MWQRYIALTLFVNRCRRRCARNGEPSMRKEISVPRAFRAKIWQGDLSMKIDTELSRSKGISRLGDLPKYIGNRRLEFRTRSSTVNRCYNSRQRDTTPNAPRRKTIFLPYIFVVYSRRFSFFNLSDYSEESIVLVTIVCASLMAISL